MKDVPKDGIQDALYEFPYHYLPRLDRGVVPRLHRHLSWGLDYLTYTSFVVDQVVSVSPGSLLDVGCGDGRLISLVKSSVSQVFGVDVSERALAYARAFNPDVGFWCGSVADLTGTYDMITLVEVLEHISDAQIEQFIQHVWLLTREDGHLLVSVPTTNVRLNAKHYRHYDLALLKAALGPHFVIKKHWWLVRLGAVVNTFRSVLANRFFILNWPPALAAIWHLHKKHTFFADASTGAHLVCLASRLSGGTSR